MPVKIMGHSSGSVTLAAPADGTDMTMTVTAGSMVPSGVVSSFAGSSAPTGWLMCDGSTVSRTTYSDLFSVIGTTYGSGDGSTTFALPDLRGRFVAGVDNMGGTDAGRINWSNTLGTSGGSQTHTLSSTNLPPHNHELPDSPDNSGTLGPNYGAAGSDASFNTSIGHHGFMTGPGTIRSAQLNSTPVDHMPPAILLNYIIKV